MIYFLFILLSVGSISSLFAYAQTTDEPLTTSAFQVTQTHINQIDQMHSQAEGQIIKNDFHNAIKTYLDILLIEPDDETAYTSLGQIYMILGSFSHAKDAYMNALHINPHNETAMRGLQKIIDPDSLSTDEANIQT